MHLRFTTAWAGLEERRSFRIHNTNWSGQDEKSMSLQEIMLELLADWGSFLDANLYREALVYFMGKHQACIQPVAIMVADRIVGQQKMPLLDPSTTWHLSTIKRGINSYQTHLIRLLNHTPLQRIQWINLNQRDITLTTIIK